MEQRNWWPRGWRGLALLVIGGVMAANLISPAIANIGTVNHLWNQHIKPKGDARWVRQNGPILVGVPVTSWEVNDGSNAGSHLFRTANILSWSRDTAGTSYIDPSAAVPTALYGKSVELLGMELCYDATSGGVYLDLVELWVFRSSVASFPDNVLHSQDQTDRTDDTCRTYLLDAPFTLTGDDVVAAALGMTTTAPDSGISIARMTYILQPSGTNAVIPSKGSTAVLRPVSGDKAAEGIIETRT